VVPQTNCLALAACGRQHAASWPVLAGFQFTSPSHHAPVAGQRDLTGSRTARLLPSPACCKDPTGAGAAAVLIASGTEAKGMARDMGHEPTGVRFADRRRDIALILPRLPARFPSDSGWSEAPHRTTGASWKTSGIATGNSPARGNDWILNRLHFNRAAGELVGCGAIGPAARTTLLPPEIAGFECPPWPNPDSGPGSAGEPALGRAGAARRWHGAFQGLRPLHLDAWRNTCFAACGHARPQRASWLLSCSDSRPGASLSTDSQEAATAVGPARALAPGPALVVAR